MAKTTKTTKPASAPKPRAAAKPAPAPKTAAKPRPTVAEGHASKKGWKKPRPGTMRARVLAAMIDTPRTVAEIAKAAGVPEDRVLPHVYATWRDCGIGYKVDGEKYQADLPEGVTGENVFVIEPAKTE
jgi:hypothetical protein